METQPGPLHGTVLFRPRPVADARGYFTRTFDLAAAARAGIDGTRFLQDSQSRSAKGVVRGLHFRTDGGEAKLVRCAHGAVYDVAVDLRPWSPTFLQHQAIVLDDVEHVAVYLPPGLAHGLQALTESSDVCYRIDREHDPAADATLRWDDPALGISWPLPVTVISARDLHAPLLSELKDRLPEWFAEPAPADLQRWP